MNVTVTDRLITLKSFNFTPEYLKKNFKIQKASFTHKTTYILKHLDIVAKVKLLKMRQHQNHTKARFIAHPGLLLLSSLRTHSTNAGKHRTNMRLPKSGVKNNFGTWCLKSTQKILPIGMSPNSAP